LIEIEANGLAAFVPSYVMSSSADFGTVPVLDMNLVEAEEKVR